jgi:hypothetical protein
VRMAQVSTSQVVEDGAGNAELHTTQNVGSGG